METLHNVYVQKGYDSNIYEMYSFKIFNTANTLRHCASSFGLTAFIITVETSQQLTHTCNDVNAVNLFTSSTKEWCRWDSFMLCSAFVFQQQDMKTIVSKKS